MNPEEPRCISYDEWVDEFSPVDEYPMEKSDLKKRLTSPSKAWTLIETDHILSVIPGVHIVNAIGYYITSKAHNHELVKVQDNC